MNLDPLKIVAEAMKVRRRTRDDLHCIVVTQGDGTIFVRLATAGFEAFVKNGELLLIRDGASITAENEADLVASFIAFADANQDARTARCIAEARA